MSFYTYILLCADNSYYTGQTEDLENRVASHQRGDIQGYTFTRRPVRLVWLQVFESRIEALDWERRIKGWSRAKKEALILGRWTDLQWLARSRTPKEPDQGICAV